MDVQEAVEAVWVDLERGVRPTEAVRGKLDLDQAYHVQFDILRRLVAREEKIAGWKIGGNSDAARELFATNEPFGGFLLESGRYDGGHEFELARLPGSAVIECEVAFIFKERLAGPDVTRADVLTAVDSIAPAFEIATVSRVPGLDLAQLVSDNVSQWGYVIGEAIPFRSECDLGAIEVIAERDGEVAQRGLSRDAVDDQIDSIVWLAHNLAKFGAAIESGHTVLSGSCLRPAPVGGGERWRATFATLGTIEASFI